MESHKKITKIGGSLGTTNHKIASHKNDDPSQKSGVHGTQNHGAKPKTALDNRAAASKDVVDNFKERLVQLETTDHFFEGRLDNRDDDIMVAVQQIARESQKVVQAVVDRVYIHCTRLHKRQAAQQVAQGPGTAAIALGGFGHTDIQ